MDVGLWDIVELTVGPEGILVKGIGGSSNASNTTVVLWSGDGRQFTMVLENGNPPGAAIGDLAIAGDHERYVAIAQQCVGCWPPTDDWSIAHEVLVSNDGPAWLSVTTSPFADLPNGEQLEVLSLETRNGVALAATRDRSGASQLLRSSDLVHWSDVTPWSASDKSDSAWSTVTAGPAGWLARMQQDQATWAWLSTDAHNWHLIQPPADVGAFDTLPAEQWAIGTDRVVYLPITGPAASAWIWVAALVGF